MEILGLFLAHGAHWLLLLAALALIGATNVDEEDRLRRWKAAFSTRTFGRGAVLIVLAAWAEHFGRLQWGGQHLRGGGVLPWLPMALVTVVPLLAVIAWLGYERWPRLRPWLSLALVVGLIVGAVQMLGDAPQEPLTQGDRGAAVRFIQQRLQVLGCFAAAGEPQDAVGEYGAPTFMAVTSFQQANGLDKEGIDLPNSGKVRPEYEWLLLKRPFPALGGARRCGAPARRGTP